MKAVKISIAALAIAGLCAGLTGRANAQAPATTTEVTKPFTVKIGGLFPSNKDAGSSLISFGLGYDFLKTKTDSPILLQGYVDYFGPTDETKESFNRRVKNNFEYGIGVGVAARYMLMQGKPAAAGFSPYGFVGLGIYSVKAKQEITSILLDQGSTPTSVSSRSKTKTSLGGKIGLGAELKSGIFGELEYNFLPEVEDIKVSGFGARLGYRF